MKTAIQKKVCLLGDFSVGKTSLVERFVYNRFDERYLSTIGVKIARKTVNLPNDLIAQLLIWDLAEGEEYAGTQASYVQGSAGALLVCDLTRASTLLSIEKYAHQLRSIRANTPFVVVANKADLTEQREIDDSLLQTIATNLDAPLMITSAKTGDGVNQTFSSLAKKVLNL